MINCIITDNPTHHNLTPQFKKVQALCRMSLQESMSVQKKGAKTNNGKFKSRTEVLTLTQAGHLFISSNLFGISRLSILLLCTFLLAPEKAKSLLHQNKD